MTADGDRASSRGDRVLCCDSGDDCAAGPVLGPSVSSWNTEEQIPALRLRACGERAREML